MAKENAIFDKKEQLNEELTESFDFDELEEKLQSQLNEELTDMQFLTEEKKKIGSPDNLGNVIMGVVWEQFLNQLAVTAGDDFIKENKGLHLDLRKEVHIQTTENFTEGKIAAHNTEINYQERYDDWQTNFVKDKNGNVVMHNTRTGEEKATLAKDARKIFDKDRPRGSFEKNTAMDHTVSAAEIIRDPVANAHMTKEEQIAFANSDANLNEISSSLNSSKSDMSTTEWLDNPNVNGQKPDEIFDISAEEIAKMRQKDGEAREEYEKQKKVGEQKSIEAGQKSQKEELFRISGKALRVVLMQLFAELVREIIAKLVKWFKSAKKALETLLDSLKEAIHSFIAKMKIHLINAGNTFFSTVATAIIGPVFGMIKKVWMMLKQGWSSLKNAVNHIKNPANKDKPVGILLMEVGKIVLAGMTVVGALLLGEVIEKGLMTIPIFAVEIPLLGSLANILGFFFSAVVAGIIGAIAINLIEKQIEKSMKRNNVDSQIKKSNEILNQQYQVQVVSEAKMEYTKSTAIGSIFSRHEDAASTVRANVETIRKNLKVPTETNNEIDEVSAELDKMMNED